MRGNNLDSVRRNNLSMVLDIISRNGAASRADITRFTGLNRSTVAALVAELSALGIVVESNPDSTSTVGRPSPIVSPRRDLVAIAVNPEVDAITVGVIGLAGEVVRHERFEADTPPSAEVAVSMIADIVAELRANSLADHRIIGIGVAVPALVSAADGLVRWAPHLGWIDEPIAPRLTDATGLPVWVGNDASLGALAEHLRGAGRGIDDMVYLNGGASGIGGGVIASGVTIGGLGGYAGEFGHNRPGVTESSDRRTADGALEDEVSRARLLAIVGLETADDATLSRAILGSTDAAVTAEVARQRRILATALSNAVNVLNPALVVLGGFLATLLEADPGALRSLVTSQSLPAAGEDLRITSAALGEDRLLIGAAHFAFSQLLGDPVSISPSSISSSTAR
jgi:predicted NBD/HSP70 family sugar kinase